MQHIYHIETSATWKYVVDCIIICVGIRQLQNTIKNFTLKKRKNVFSFKALMFIV